ncbi:MAG: potassium/hydrogen antiporter, partial [Actinomycetota bacterium]|nr:potassium/hydrogen antiporter [Actinomycetota bacterium]
MGLHEFDLALLAVSAILLAAVIGVRIVSGTLLPALLVFIAIGVAIGESGLGVKFEDAGLAQILGLLALAIILAEGGLTTRWSDIRPALGLAAVLATVGVFVSVAVMAALAGPLLGMDTRTALLLGAVVSSTDAAAVFSVLRRFPLASRAAAVLEAESGFNDAPVVILVTLIVSPSWQSHSWYMIIVLMFAELAGGAAIGLVGGWLSERLLRRLALPAVGLYPLTALALLLLIYAGASFLHLSGFLAVYLAAVLLGNAGLPHRRGTLAFVEGIAWLAQIGLFIMLGMLASPSRLPQVLGPALLMGCVLLFLARPASIVAGTVWFRLSWREQVFLSAAGLRGAVPIVLTTIPLTAGLPGADRVFDTVFVLVIVFTALQAPLLPSLARGLNLVEETDPHAVDMDSAPLEEMDGDALHAIVPPGSRLVGVNVSDLALPGDAMVFLVIRGGRAVIPDTGTCLCANDRLVVVTPPGTREDVERRLRDVAAHGR